VSALRVAGQLHRASGVSLRAWIEAAKPDVLRRVAAAVRATRTRSLTILRLGLGRDSLAMLGLLVEGKLVAGGQPVLPEDVDAVVFTDPGAEWQHSYALIPRVQELCDRYGLRFIAQRKPPEHGAEGWRQWVTTRTIGSRAEAPWRAERPGETIEEKAARGYYHARAPIMADYASKGMVVAYKDASCTVNHKIGPNRALMHDLAVERFGAWAGNAAWSAAVKRGDRPPHRVLIGIAADEEDRLHDCAGPAYERTFYPLAELGVAKADEQPILDRHGFGEAKKSGCVMCKFQPIEWYWALSEVDPAKFEEVAAFEANALRTSPSLLLFPKGVPPSNGWNGDPRPAKERPRLPIREAVALWRELNPHATIDAVLSKAYACERVTGESMRAATAKARANPRGAAACDRAALRRAFAADAAKLMDGLQAAGHETVLLEAP
jgi:hypothetical protein